MEINPGQMSRILVTLFNYGFLTREQEQSRYYYTTNKESISAFFRQAQQLLTGRAEQ
jgi:DNA-binding IclR family transcriptional regulator